MSKFSRFVARKQLETRKMTWQLLHNQGSPAETVFVLGAQRSGTTMLIRCLNESLEIEMLGEASRAMDNWRLRDLDTVREIVSSSRAKVVIFKPLTESHRARELLAEFPRSVICWVYRRASDRANSAVARFGAHNLEYLSAFARGELLDTWQAQGLSDESVRLLKTFDFSSMSPHSASGLFWYIRNALFFEQELQFEARVLPVAYENIVSEPERIIRGLCRFFGCKYSPRMSAQIHTKSVGKKESRLAADIEELCEGMYARLEAVQRERWRQLDLP